MNEKEDDEKHALNTMSKTNNWRLWHYRLGHLGKQNMKKIIIRRENYKLEVNK